MENSAAFGSSRGANLFIAMGLLIIPLSAFYITLFMNEDDFLGIRSRKGGIFKIFEQLVGWNYFVTIVILFGIFGGIYAFVYFWKVIDNRPDVTAFLDRIEFHPAVRSSPVSYDEVSHWNMRLVSGHPVVSIHLHHAYWSWSGLFKRKTIKIEGDRDQVAPILEFFVEHPLMNKKIQTLT